MNRINLKTAEVMVYVREIDGLLAVADFAVKLLHAGIEIVTGGFLA